MDANVTLYEDGKLRPHIEAGGKVTADAAKGSVSASIGTDKYDVHVKADGELGHAEAKGQFRAGIIEKEDANGNKTTERGVGMEFGAEAYMNNLRGVRDSGDRLRAVSSVSSAGLENFSVSLRICGAVIGALGATVFVTSVVTMRYSRVLDEHISDILY